ncbi:MAG TPA: hypothetical protein VMU35_00890 [Methylomirabilota bacterium]|nr:hypothetical protein [Methylomirabilota bacterium]
MDSNSSLRSGSQTESSSFIWNVAGAVACFAHDKAAAEAFFAFVVNFAGSVADVTLNHTLARVDLSTALAFNAVCRHRTAAVALRTIYFTVTITSIANQ